MAAVVLDVAAVDLSVCTHDCPWCQQHSSINASSCFKRDTHQRAHMHATPPADRRHLHARTPQTRCVMHAHTSAPSLIHASVHTTRVQRLPPGPPAPAMPLLASSPTPHERRATTGMPTRQHTPQSFPCWTTALCCGHDIRMHVRSWSHMHTCSLTRSTPHTCRAEDRCICYRAYVQSNY
jgi:hypothetical protein